MKIFVTPEVLREPEKFGPRALAWKYLMNDAYTPDLGTGLMVQISPLLSSVMAGRSCWSSLGLSAPVTHEVKSILEGFLGRDLGQLATFLEMVHLYKGRSDHDAAVRRYHLGLEEAARVVELDYNAFISSLPGDFMGYMTLDDGIYQTADGKSFYNHAYVYVGKISNYHRKNAIVALREKNPNIDDETRVFCMFMGTADGRSAGMYLNLSGERVLSGILGKADINQIQTIDANCKLFLNCAALLDRKKG